MRQIAASRTGCPQVRGTADLTATLDMRYCDDVLSTTTISNGTAATSHHYRTAPGKPVCPFGQRVRGVLHRASDAGNVRYSRLDAWRIPPMKKPASSRLNRLAGFFIEAHLCASWRTRSDASQQALSLNSLHTQHLSSPSSGRRVDCPLEYGPLADDFSGARSS